MVQGLGLPARNKPLLSLHTGAVKGSIKAVTNGSFIRASHPFQASTNTDTPSTLPVRTLAGTTTLQCQQLDANNSGQQPK